MEALARAIAGADATIAQTDQARIIAEAQLDLTRIRSAKLKIEAHLLDATASHVLTREGETEKNDAPIEVEGDLQLALLRQPVEDRKVRTQRNFAPPAGDARFLAGRLAGRHVLFWIISHDQQCTVVLWQNKPKKIQKLDARSIPGIESLRSGS